MQNADSSFRFDDLDAALHSGSSDKRAVMVRQVAGLFLSEAERPLNLLPQLSLRTTEAVRFWLLSPSTRIAFWSLETE